MRECVRNDWDGSRVKAPKFKKINESLQLLLTWPQNTGNPISGDLNFKHFSVENAPEPPVSEADLGGRGPGD